MRKENLFAVSLLDGSYLGKEYFKDRNSNDSLHSIYETTIIEI